jgi:hypothetical protein
MNTCAHEHFQCVARVGRLSEVDGGPITGYTADITICCADCGLPFEFLGMEPGSSPVAPRCSIDAAEARLPIAPRGMRMNPLQQMAHGKRQFDS